MFFKEAIFDCTKFLGKFANELLIDDAEQRKNPDVNICGMFNNKLYKIRANSSLFSVN